MDECSNGRSTPSGKQIVYTTMNMDGTHKKYKLKKNYKLKDVQKIEAFKKTQNTHIKHHMEQTKDNTNERIFNTSPNSKRVRKLNISRDKCTYKPNKKIEMKISKNTSYENSTKGKFERSKTPLFPKVTKYDIDCTNKKTIKQRHNSPDIHPNYEILLSLKKHIKKINFSNFLLKEQNKKILKSMEYTNFNELLLENEVLQKEIVKMRNQIRTFKDNSMKKENNTYKGCYKLNTTKKENEEEPKKEETKENEDTFKNRVLGTNKRKSKDNNDQQLIEQLKEENQRLKDSLSNNEKYNEIETLRKKLKELEEENNELTKEKNQMENFQREKEELLLRIENYKKEKEENILRNETLEKEKEENLSRIESLEKELSELKEQNGSQFKTNGKNINTNISNNSIIKEEAENEIISEINFEILNEKEEEEKNKEDKHTQTENIEEENNNNLENNIIINNSPREEDNPLNETEKDKDSEKISIKNNEEEEEHSKKSENENNEDAEIQINNRNEQEDLLNTNPVIGFTNQNENKEESEKEENNEEEEEKKEEEK
ncbi:MAG: hypothetical protein MJ252_19045, partial [archaeon]|nr:hypothetical protein [archaeon]